MTMTDEEKKLREELISMLGTCETFNYVEYAMKSGESYADIRKRVLLGVSTGLLSEEKNGTFTVDRARLSSGGISERKRHLWDISDKLVPKMINIVDSAMREPGIDKDTAFSENALAAFVTRRMIATLQEMRIIRIEDDKLYPEIGTECWERLKLMSELKPR